MKLHVSAAILTLSLPLAADPLFPIPSVPDVSDGDGWSFALGAGIEYEAEYDGSDDYGTEFEPAGAIQWRQGNHMWFLEGPELGWRARLDHVWLLQAGVRLEGGREESEAPELAGLGDTDDEVVFMLESRRALGGDWNNWAGARIMAGDDDIGLLGVLAVGHTFAASRPGMGVDLFAFTTFGSAEFINRDFGVTATQSANSGLRATDLDSGYRSIGVQAVGRWRFGDRWQLQAQAGFEKYNSDISDSPIALDDYEAEVGTSLLYRF